MWPKTLSKKGEIRVKSCQAWKRGMLWLPSFPRHLSMCGCCLYLRCQFIRYSQWWGRKLPFNAQGRQEVVHLPPNVPVVTVKEDSTNIQTELLYHISRKYFWQRSNGNSLQDFSMMISRLLDKVLRRYTI